MGLFALGYPLTPLQCVRHMCMVPYVKYEITDGWTNGNLRLASPRSVLTDFRVSLGRVQESQMHCDIV